MTIRSSAELGGFTVDCDHPSCHKNLEVEGGFDEAVKTLKEENWWFAKQGGFWKHYCPQHKPNYHNGKS